MVKIRKLSQIGAKLRKSWNSSTNDRTDDEDDYSCDPEKDFSAYPVRSTLFVEICGNRFFLSRKIAAKRYCQLKNDELIVAKSQSALNSKSAVHWNVREAAAFMIHQGGNRDGVVKKKTQGKLPSTVEITDKSGRRIRLYFANQKEMAYWLEPLKQAYLKKDDDTDDEISINPTAYFDQDEFQSDDAVAADAENFESFEKPCSSAQFLLEALDLAQSSESKATTASEGDANQAYERKLQRLGEMLLEKRDVLRKRLGLDLTDDGGQMAQAKTSTPMDSGFVPLESPIFPVKDAMSSVDDVFHNEQINSEEYRKLKNATVNSSTESGIACLPDEERRPVLEDFENVGEDPKKTLVDYPVTSGSPIFKFVAPLYPIPFTKVVAGKSFSDSKFSSSDVTDGVIEENAADEVFRSVSFSAAANQPVTGKCVDTVCDFSASAKHLKSVNEPKMDENAFNQSPSFVSEDRRASRVKFLTSTVANDKNRKMIPPPSFSFDETTIDHPYRKSTFPTSMMRTTKVQTNFATTSDQMMATSLIQNLNCIVPPYKATVKISRAAEPQRVNFATVGFTIKSSNLSVEQQCGTGSFSSKVTMHVSPVSYVYTPFNITCKLCRRDT